MHEAAEHRADYRPEIDGLRAFAVLSILLHHAGIAWLPGGYLGVDVFFVISGYVITRILVSDLDAGSFTLAGFWRRRARRIIPALAVLLAVCLPVAWASLSPDQMAMFLPVFVGAATFVPNMVLLFQTGYFNPGSETLALLHLWSLGVEEQFYLLFPLLLLAVWRYQPTRLRTVLLGLALASFVLSMIMVSQGPRAGFYLLPTRACELLAGSLAVLAHWRSDLKRRQMLTIAGLVLILVPMLTYQELGPGLAMFPPVAGAVLCLMHAGTDTWLGKGLALRPVVLIGKISFGAYLWHWPLLAFTRVYQAGEPSLGVKLGLMLVALVLGWISYRFVETPFRRTTDPVRPGWGIGAGLATLSVLALAGLLAWVADAKGWRQLTWAGYPPEAIEVMKDASRRLKREDICHLPTTDLPSGPFIEDWKCRAVSEENLIGWPVAIYGDSHGADFSKVIRLAGRNPMQMTAANCSVVVSEMRPDCLEMAEKLRAAAKADGIGTIILVNRWDPPELTPEALVELEIWWGEAFDRIVLVGPLPRFHHLEERLLRWPRSDVAVLVPSFANTEAFDKARKRVAGSEMQVIDPVPLFCADRPTCSPLGDGPLMLDASGHLTVEGAGIYAKNLDVSGVLDTLVP